MDERRPLQATSTPAIDDRMNVATGSVVQDDGLIIKEEWAYIEVEIEPAALQHTDTHHRHIQPDLSIVKQERSIDDNINPIPCDGVKEEVIEYEPRDAQHGKEETQPEQRAQSPLHRCDKCTKTYKVWKNLYQHYKREHGTGVHKCTECNKKYKCKDYLARHIRYAHSTRQHACSVCKTVCKTEKLLHEHVALCRGRRSAADTDAQCSNEVAQSEQRAESQLHSCDECVITFASKDSLLRHCRNLHSTESHKCTKCDEIYPSKSSLRIHTDNAHSERLFQCAVCEKIFKWKSNLEHHVNMVHRRRPACPAPTIYICNYCQATFANKRNLTVHVTRVHASESYECSQCDRYFKCEQYLKKHTTRAHAADAQRGKEETQPEQQAESPLHRCDKCTKTYKEMKTLNEHYKREHGTGLHKCTECNKKYKCKAYLARHVRFAHSKQQHACSICKTVCKSVDELSEHVARCRGSGSAADTDAQCSKEAAQSEQRAVSQLYSCDKCVKVYTSKNSLFQHYRNLHSTESHKCTKCDKIFPSKAYLHIHMGNAHGKQLYECAVCKKIYKWKTALNQHVYQVHRTRPAGSKSRMYICDYCQKTFTVKRNFTIHIIQVHTSGSYECSRCNKRFKCERYLTKHTRRTHKAGSHQLRTCTNCGKNFKSKWRFERHEKSGACARPTARNESAVASTSTQQHGVVVVKEEPTDVELELGPVVFQHVDCNYRPYKEKPQLD